MSRIKLNSSLMDVAMVMSEGNPGALNVVMALWTNGDPFAFHCLLMCDTLELYGARLYMFAHDCCLGDMGTLKKVIRAYQRGEITKAEINEHVGDVGGRGKPFEFGEDAGHGDD